MKKKLLLQFGLVFMFFISGIIIGKAQTHDLSVSIWYLPQTSGNLSNSETVRFGITNNGTQDESNFIVAFSQDNGVTWSEETHVDVVPTGQTRPHTFSATANLATDGASYPFIGKVVLEGDENSDNDQMEVEVSNRIVGDMCDEPIEITSFPYHDNRDISIYNNDYGYNSNFTAPNYLSDKDVIYSFTTTENQMYIDASLVSNYTGNFNPSPAIHVISACPESSFATRAYATDSYDPEFTNGYLYYAQTYYVVVSKRYTYDFTYDLDINVYRQHDFKSFGFSNPDVDGVIDYENHVVNISVPSVTDITNLIPVFETPAYLDVKVNNVVQTSNSSVVDFTNDVVYTMVQTISPYATQTWTVKVTKNTSTEISSSESKDISIFPNPTNGKITISKSDFSNKIDKILIFNSSGVLCYTKQFNTQEKIVLSLDHLNSGVYYMKIYCGTREIIKNFIKK